METQKTFEEAISKYGALITKICYYFASDSEEFKDLRQEVFFNIWKGIDKFRQDSKLSTWIYRISFNTCISFHRKEKKIEKISIDKIMELPVENEEASKLEEYKIMLSLIRQLKYEERALILMWLDEMSYDEISSLTGINRNTVAIRLKRIKEKLVKMVN
ncbi:MAG: sigma-70 family RNA polymerase sigma factor [Muribaculaceae bacterium]|nr:sigma-70 family RNA polymerase sigma factor [Muribaculaceae bacterium]